QAEDGIRVFHVTGVQTCALPISPGLCVPGAGALLHPAGGSTGNELMAVIREPTLLLTPDSVGEWLGTKRVSKVAILMDPAIAGSPLVEAIRSAARSAGCSTTEQLLTAPGALSTLKALASRISTSDGIVAIGGG